MSAQQGSEEGKREMRVIAQVSTRPVTSKGLPNDLGQVVYAEKIYTGKEEPTMDKLYLVELTDEQISQLAPSSLRLVGIN
jgi:hypothetical protein